MHWLMLLMCAFLYAFVGSMIGTTYALLTGANMASFMNVMIYAGFFGPVVILVIAGFRKLVRELDIPITRAIYHALLLTVAAPVLLYAASLIAATASVPTLVRALEVFKYWSIPLVFVVAVMYGIWRVFEGNRPRTTRTSGRSGGVPPSVDGGSRSATPPHRNAGGEQPHDTLRRTAEVPG